MILDKDVILTLEQIAAEERRWLSDAPIAELAEVKGVTVDEAVKLRTDAILQEAAVPIEVTVRPIEPQGKLIGFASVNYGGVVIDDFKVVDGKNGIFLRAPSKPDPTSRTGYRSTVRINDRATQERLNTAGAQAYHSAVEKLIARAEAVRPTPIKEQMAQAAREAGKENAARTAPAKKKEARMTGDVTSRQIVPKSPACPEGLFLMDGIEGLRSLPKHSVDMLLTDPPYGTTRNFWDVPLPLRNCGRRSSGRSSRMAQCCFSHNAPMIRCWGHPTSLCFAMNGCGTKAGVLAFSTQGGLP